MLTALILAGALDVDLTSAFVAKARADELFATHLSAAGDVDADGRGDLIVLSVSETGSGIARVLSGLDGTPIHTIQALGFASVSFQPGPKAAGVGDVDLDGHDDFAIGDTLTSRVTVYSGSDASVLYVFRGFDAGDQFGTSVAGAGDVDGDGHADVVAGSGSDPGYVRVYSGADGSVLHTFFGQPGTGFGQAVAGAGDANADGHDDVIVGAVRDGTTVLNPGIPPFIPPFRANDGAGTATVFSGDDGQVLHRTVGGLPDGGFGFSVTSVGDLDGDGHDDFAAGSQALDAPPAGGEARVFSGRTGRELLTIFAGGLDAPTLIRVAGAGDVDGDGTPDVLVGIQPKLSSDPSGFVVSGSDGSTLFAFTSTSPLAALSGNTGVAAVGDVDGDGKADVAFGVSEAVFGGGFVEAFVTDD